MQPGLTCLRYNKCFDNSRGTRNEPVPSWLIEKGNGTAISMLGYILTLMMQAEQRIHMLVEQAGFIHRQALRWGGHTSRSAP